MSSTYTAPVAHADIKALSANWPLTLILRPAFNRHAARLHGKFVVTLNGRQLCISRQPLLDAARILLTEGVSPDTPIAARHAGACFDALTSTVGAAAKWAVRENETEGPRFVRWKAFSCDAVEALARFDARLVPDPVPDAECLHDADRGPA